MFRHYRVILRELVVSALPSYTSMSNAAVGKSIIPPRIPDSHPHRITSTKCRINTVVSPDDGHIAARNMYRLINILRKKLCTKLALLTKKKKLKLFHIMFYADEISKFKIFKILKLSYL